MWLQKTQIIFYPAVHLKLPLLLLPAAILEHKNHSTPGLVH